MFEIPFLNIRFYDMSISYENLNLLIAVIAVVLIIHIIVIKRSEKRALKFSNYEVLEKMLGKEAAVEENILPLILRLLVLIFIIFSITNFQVTFRGYQSNMNFLVALDTSTSMLNPDMKPSRLAASEKAVESLIEKIPTNTKSGIVEFGGTANIVVGLTDDRDELKRGVNNITYSSSAGTAIGDSIILSVTELKDLPGNRSIILLTDGSNNRGVSINESMKYAKNENVSVYTIGIGNSINETNETNETMDVPEKYRNGTVTVTKSGGGYNPEVLRNLANQTGGRFMEVEEERELERIFERTALKKEKVSIKPTFYLLAISAILLILEWALGATKYKTLP